MNWNDIFRYDNNTGKLYWLVLPKCHRPDGEAGSKEKDAQLDFLIEEMKKAP